MPRDLAGLELVDDHVNFVEWSCCYGASGTITPGKSLFSRNWGSKTVAVRWRKIQFDPRVAQPRGLGLGCEPVGVVGTVNPFRPHGVTSLRKPLFSEHSCVPMSKGSGRSFQAAERHGISGPKTCKRPCGFRRAVPGLEGQGSSTTGNPCLRKTGSKNGGAVSWKNPLDPRVAQPRSLWPGCETSGVVGIVAPFLLHGGHLPGKILVSEKPGGSRTRRGGQLAEHILHPRLAQP